jgi:hypothetical protein
MPVLSNPRWELFCQNRSEGMSIGKSYMLAGYATTDKQVAFACGSRLLRNVTVIARLRQLIEARAERVVVTRETLAAEIDQATERASDLDQPATVIAGAMAKAKLYGLEAPSKNVQMNINATFNQMTDEELRFELASLVNAVRAARGQPLVALPVRKGEEDENEKP